MPAAPAAATSPKIHSGAPAAYSTARNTIDSVTVVPRSGCSITRPTISRNTGATGISSARRERRLERRAARTWAAHSNSASLATSLGWNCRALPTPIQLACAVVEVTDSRHEHRDQQHERHDDRRGGQRADQPQRHPHHEEERDETQQGEPGLVGEYRERGLALLEGPHRRRRQHHQQPEPEQQPEHRKDQVQRGHRAVEPVLRRSPHSPARKAALGRGRGADRLGLGHRGPRRRHPPTPRPRAKAATATPNASPRAA